MNKNFVYFHMVTEEPVKIAPGVGLEPTSPEGHQLARLDVMIDLEADPF
jgi:hypothetical protein